MIQVASYNDIKKQSKGLVNLFCKPISLTHALQRQNYINFCFIDGILQEIAHKEDTGRQVCDSEIIITSIVPSTSFYGNHSSAIRFMKHMVLFPICLSRAGLTGGCTKSAGSCMSSLRCSALILGIFAVKYILSIPFLLRSATIWGLRAARCLKRINGGATPRACGAISMGSKCNC